MPVTDPISGATLDDSNSMVRTFPSRLAAAWAVLSTFVVARFTTATARANVITAPTAGQVSYLTSLGPNGWQGFDGQRWGPLYRRVRYEAAGGSAGGIAGTPNAAVICTTSIGPQPGPYRAVITAVLDVSSSDLAQWLVLLRSAATGGVSAGGVGGTDIDYRFHTIAANDRHTFELSRTIDTADGTAMDIVMLLSRQSGNGLAGVTGDPKINRVTVLVDPL